MDGAVVRIGLSIMGCDGEEREMGQDTFACGARKDLQVVHGYRIQG